MVPLQFVKCGISHWGFDKKWANPGAVEEGPVPAKKHLLQVMFLLRYDEIQHTGPQVKARTAALDKSRGVPRLGPALWFESARALPASGAEELTSVLGHCLLFHREGPVCDCLRLPL